MRWPLRYQILIPFAAVMLAAIFAVSVVSAVLATQRAGRQIDEQLQSMAATLVDTSFPLTDTVLRQMHGLSQAEFVCTDFQGHVLAASRRLQLPEETNPPVTADCAAIASGPAGHDRRRAIFSIGFAHRGARRTAGRPLDHPLSGTALA